MATSVQLTIDCADPHHRTWLGFEELRDVKAAGWS